MAAIQACMKNDEYFKIDDLLKSLQTKRGNIVDVAKIWTSSGGWMIVHLIFDRCSQGMNLLKKMTKMWATIQY